MSFDDFWYFELFSLGDFSITVGTIALVIIIILAARGIVWLVSRLLTLRMRRVKGVDEGRRHAILSITQYFVYTLSAFLILEAIGVNVTVLVAGSTALFVGLGFGLQSTFNDFVSGIILLFEGSLQIGDIVEVDDEVGRVIKIGIRTSHIVTRRDVNLIVPNSKFISGKVTNFSHSKLVSRFHIIVGVKYGSDTALVKKLLIQAANEHPEVAKSPSPSVLFSDFGNSSLDFNLLFWTEHTFEAHYIMSDLRFRIDALFRENNVTIPFPQRDVHFYPTDTPDKVQPIESD